MITVPSIAPSSTRNAVRILASLAGRTALAELRLDGRWRPDLRRLLAGTRPPVIVTFRSEGEGGKGREPVASTVSKLKEALSAGAEFIDVEERLGPRAIAQLESTAGAGRMILSRHGKIGTRRQAERIFRRMARRKPAIVKLAPPASSFADTTVALTLLGLAGRLGQPSAVICTGEFGVYTRVLQGAFGGAISFASLGHRCETAPGQLAFEEMESLYRAGSAGPRTRIFGLVGNPVAHSPGTRYHNAVFARLGLDAVYVNFLVDEIRPFMSAVAPLCSGFSVTMPFKTAVIPFLDRLDASATSSGSVNTVVRRSGRMHGSNTDYAAILAFLRKAPAARGKKLLVIGTGGAARSAAAAAAACGARLVVAGRNPARAGSLAAEFGGSSIPIGDIRDAGPDILVNATPVGMAPREGVRGRSSIVPPDMLRRGMLVCDFANPVAGPTRLIAGARSRRCRVVTGRDLFELQASLQSALFLRAGGRRP